MFNALCLCRFFHGVSMCAVIYLYILQLMQLMGHIILYIIYVCAYILTCVKLSPVVWEINIYIYIYILFHYMFFIYCVTRLWLFMIHTLCGGGGRRGGFGGGLTFIFFIFFLFFIIFFIHKKNQINFTLLLSKCLIVIVHCPILFISLFPGLNTLDIYYWLNLILRGLTDLSVWFDPFINQSNQLIGTFIYLLYT